MRIAILTAAALAAGCTLSARQGQFSCDDESDCPDGWYCDQDEGACYSDADADADTDADADADSDADTDADSDADADADADSDSDADTDTDADTDADGGADSDTNLDPCPEPFECLNPVACNANDGTEHPEYACDGSKVCCELP